MLYKDPCKKFHCDKGSGKKFGSPDELVCGVVVLLLLVLRTLQALVFNLWLGCQEAQSKVLCSTAWTFLDLHFWNNFSPGIKSWLLCLHVIWLWQFAQTHSTSISVRKMNSVWLPTPRLAEFTTGQHEAGTETPILQPKAEWSTPGRLGDNGWIWRHTSGSAGTLVSLNLMSSDDSWESSKHSRLASMMPVLFSADLCLSFYLECSPFHFCLANCHSSFYHLSSSFSLAVSSLS